MFYCSNNTNISNNTVILCNKIIDYFTNIICDKDNKCYCLCINNTTEDNNIFSNINVKQYGISLLLFIFLLICCSCYVLKYNKFCNINYTRYNNISENTINENTINENTINENTINENTRLPNNEISGLPNYNDINYSILPIYTTTTNNNYTYITPPMYSQIYNL